MKNIDYSQFKNCTFRINADIEAQVCYVTKNNCMQIKLDKDDILEIKDISYNRGIIKVYFSAKSYYLIDKEDFDNHIKEFEIDTEIYNESSIKTFTQFINENRNEFDRYDKDYEFTDFELTKFNLTYLENSKYVIKAVKWFDYALYTSVKILFDSGEIETIMMKYDDGQSGFMKSEDFCLDNNTYKNVCQNIRKYFTKFHRLQVQLGDTQFIN